MSFQVKWGAFAARLGTSPRQLALLLASLFAAVGIFGAKLAFAPKSAEAAPVAAAVIAKPAEPAVALIPESLLIATPYWDLARLPARSPFASPADMNPALDLTTAAAEHSGSSAGPDLDLQATLDRSLAVINGKTLRVGQTWTDAKSKRSFQLIEVGDRHARIRCGSHVFEIALDG